MTQALIQQETELRLDLILQSIDRIRSYVAGMDLSRFQTEALVFDAVSLRMLLIGKAIGRLPSRLKVRFAAFPWKSMARRARFRCVWKL